MRGFGEKSYINRIMFVPVLFFVKRSGWIKYQMTMLNQVNLTLI